MRQKFRGMPDETLLEYGVHDTFDALSPRFDRPSSVSAMRSIAASVLERPFEVVDDGPLPCCGRFFAEGRPNEHVTWKGVE